MEAASYLRSSLVCFLLFPFLFCRGIGLPLRHGWSFSADLSRSSPLPFNAFPPLSPSLFTPILTSSNFSSAKGFSLGFLTLFGPSSASPTSIFLTICLGTNMKDSRGMAYAVPVWNWAIRKPLKQVGSTGRVSLRAEATRGEGEAARGDVDLVLVDGDGSEVWRVEQVVAMEMHENGNWVLYNSRNKVAWESFGELRDTLVQGQRLYEGEKLVSSNSVFSMEMMPGGLLFYMNSEAPSPLYYWGFPINTTAVVEYLAMHALDLSSNPPLNVTASFLSSACPGFPTKPYASLTGKNLTVDGGCLSSQWTNYVNVQADATYESDFLRLTDTGVAEGFTYLYQLGQHILLSAQSNTSSCFPPNACGPYGICTSSAFGARSSCHCPSADDNAQLSHLFNPINPSDPSQGCVRAQPLQCNARVNSTLAEISRSSVTPIHLLYETNYMNNTYPLEDCMAHCLSNCSCAGFVYHTGSSFCLPFSDTTGLSNISFFDLGNPAFSVFVKVQSDVSSMQDVAGRVPGSATLPSQANHSDNHLFKPVIYVIIGTVMAAMVVGLSILSLKKYKNHVWTRKDPSEMDSDVGEEDLGEILPMFPVRYSFRELREVTRGFDKLLGSGAHGYVYEGMLRDGRKVAVKKLDQVLPRRKQFLAEVATMGAISHYNVVRLYGFCSQRSKRLLVYEFMENGSLDQWLFSRSEDRVLSWRTRFQIALGTAHGLAYLHGGCPKPIIHFDVKPSNILLDRSFVPKISDFGLSKLVERESSFVLTGIRGTRGYLAPEWLSNSGVSKKCDVYSYGMVLLELVGGRRNVVHQSLEGSDEWYFPAWAAIRCQQGSVLELVDKRLAGSFDEEQVRIVVHVAFMCIQREPNLRPNMGVVCKILEGVVPLGEEPPYSGAALGEPLSPEPAFSFESCSILTQGR